MFYRCTYSLPYGEHMVTYRFTLNNHLHIDAYRWTPIGDTYCSPYWP